MAHLIQNTTFLVGNPSAIWLIYQQEPDSSLLNHQSRLNSGAAWWLRITPLFENRNLRVNHLLKNKKICLSGKIIKNHLEEIMMIYKM
jgi:hypothetical protein